MRTSCGTFREWQNHAGVIIVSTKWELLGGSVFEAYPVARRTVKPITS